MLLFARCINETSQEDIRKTIPETKTPLTQTDEVADFLSKIQYVGVYKPERNVIIIGEQHRNRAQSLAVAANLALIYQKKNYVVKLYAEGLLKDSCKTFNAQGSNMKFTFCGIESKVRQFPREKIAEHDLEQQHALQIFAANNYPLQYNFSSQDAANFKSALREKSVNTELLKKYYYSIIKPLDDDILSIVKSTPQNEVAILICGNRHAADMQRSSVGANVIKLYSQQEDNATFLTVLMYRYILGSNV